MRGMYSLAVTIAAMLVSSQAAVAGEQFPRIVTVVAPLKPYVDEIIRGQGEAQNLLRPGQEPHDFALTMPQGEMLAKADIVIVPDLSVNPLLKRVLAKNPKVRVIELSKLEGAEPLPYAGANPWVAAMAPLPEKPAKHKHTHEVKLEEKDKRKEDPQAIAAEKAKLDPHLWLDPERMAAMAVPLANAISETKPESRVELVANARILSRHLRNEVMPALREMLGKPSTPSNAVGRPEIPFITYHAAYQYFLWRFKLTHYGEIMTRPEEALGARSIATMISGAESMKVRCIIGEHESALMVRLAKITGARIVILSPEQLVDRKKVDTRDWIQNDYDRLLYVTAKEFSKCL